MADRKIPPITCEGTPAPIRSLLCASIAAPARAGRPDAVGAHCHPCVRRWPRHRGWRSRRLHVLVDHVLQPLSAGGALGAGQLQPPVIAGQQERGRVVSIAARCGQVEGLVATSPSPAVAAPAGAVRLGLRPLSAGGELSAGQLQPPAIAGLQERGRAVSIAARCGGWMGCWPRLRRRRSPRLQVLVDQALRPLSAGGAVGAGQLQLPAIGDLQERGRAASIAVRWGR